jgi:RNA polymerase sigma factor (TIGR02999 family)
MDITLLLNRWRDGDERALDELMPIVYAELRKLARHYIRGERQNHTLQPTALVHEAFLRLNTHESGFSNRVHFYAAAARAMRRVLVDHAREQHALKRGSGIEPVRLDDVTVAVDLNTDLVALHDTLAALERVAPDKARVVELRYFGGMSVEETAEYLGVSPATVKRSWRFSRAWLYRELNRV